MSVEALASHLPLNAVYDGEIICVEMGVVKCPWGRGKMEWP